jgi:hypothetical protein
MGHGGGVLENAEKGPCDFGKYLDSTEKVSATL